MAHRARDSSRRNRLDRSARAESRARHLARVEELVDRVPFGCHRAPALRRQRVRRLRHVRHGPGRAHHHDADCRTGARPGARSHRRRDGRHVGRSVRLVDVGQPLHRLHGQRGDRRVRQRQEAAAQDGRGQSGRPRDADRRPAEGALRTDARRGDRHRRSGKRVRAGPSPSAGAPPSGS